MKQQTHNYDTPCNMYKRMSCSLLIGHMQIFKSIDFRTMGLSKWITFILIHTLYNTCLLAISDLCCEQTSECYSIDEVERAHNSELYQIVYINTGQ